MNGLSKPWIVDYLTGCARRFGSEPCTPSDRARTVQIVQFITGPTATDPNPIVYWAHISDGKSYIAGRISEAGASSYFTARGARISQCKTGIFVLKRYRPFLTSIPNEPKRIQRIALDIDEIEFYASEGEPCAEPLAQAVADSDVRRWTAGLLEGGNAGDILKNEYTQCDVKMATCSTYTSKAVEGSGGKATVSDVISVASVNHPIRCTKHTILAKYYPSPDVAKALDALWDDDIETQSSRDPVEHKQFLVLPEIVSQVELEAQQQILSVPPKSISKISQITDSWKDHSSPRESSPEVFYSWSSSPMVEFNVKLDDHDEDNGSDSTKYGTPTPAQRPKPRSPSTEPPASSLQPSFDDCRNAETGNILVLDSGGSQHISETQSRCPQSPNVTFVADEVDISQHTNLKLLERECRKIKFDEALLQESSGSSGTRNIPTPVEAHPDIRGSLLFRTVDEAASESALASQVGEAEGADTLTTQFYRGHYKSTISSEDRHEQRVGKGHSRDERKNMSSTPTPLLTNSQGHHAPAVEQRSNGCTGGVNDTHRCHKKEHGTARGELHNPNLSQKRALDGEESITKVKRLRANAGAMPATPPLDLTRVVGGHEALLLSWTDLDKMLEGIMDL